MVLTVFGATGMVGKKVLRYAIAKGYKVRAFGRNVADLIDEDLRDDDLETIKASVFDKREIFKAVKEADVVISVLGGGVDGVDKTRSLGIKNIVEQMQAAGVQRIVALGGSGVLSTANGEYILEQPDYPEEYLAVGREHLKAFLTLQASTLSWTFVCAPTIKDSDATDNFITSDLYPPTPNKNYITAGDLAHFMVDEAEKQQHVHQRVGISGS
jgi:putative NADH-flavin reductase